MTTETRLTLEEFLCLPETEPPSELISGEVITKVAPSFNHGLIVLEIGALLRDYLRVHREGRVMTEVRHIAAAEDRSYLPDLGVIRSENLPADPDVRRQGPIPVRPDFAIEVLSPADHPGRVLERVDFYLRAGTELLWLVDPDLGSITVYRPGEAPRIHRTPEIIDASPVLRDFHIDLAELFAVLDAPEED